MFNYEKYRSACSKLSLLVRKGRGGIYLGNYEVLGANVFGHQIVCDSRHSPSLKMLYVPSPLETSVIALMCQLVQPGMTCVDVGSGCGYYAILESYLAGPSGKVYAFECIPECLKLLEKNRELNDLYTIHPVNHLVSDGQKKASKDYFGGYYEFFFLPLKENDKRTLDVETVSLDHYFEDKESIIDFVKINLEGTLPSIFRGMKHLIAMNNEMSVLCRFNQDEMRKAGEDAKQFLSDVKETGMKVLQLPALHVISDEELMGGQTPRVLLLVR